MTNGATILTKVDKSASASEKDMVSARETRKALNKPNVKQSLTQAAASLKSMIDRLDAAIAAYTPIVEITQASSLLSAEASELSTETSSPIDKRPRSARTANPEGDPIDLKSASNLIATTGADITDGLFSSDSSDTERLIELEKVVDAFKATVAAILGENSVYYQQIFDRLPQELERRGG